ncbi:CU044_5270 family protein [Nocardiopsis sp. CC223A]|uniref:CU044_5270 family protein n=1 Tax=Nocardiopsis sp. CC223A TaxID=3044051 RepID=UPI00278C2FBF|nr:CU044_5270 family protein [Nocardiopsis sp. CC223A]
MNELDHLRNLRSEIPERSPEELALLTGWRPGGAGFRSVRRPRLLPLALSGVALVAAAALFLALVVFPGSLTVGVGPATAPSEAVTEGDGTGTADPVTEAMGPIIEAARRQEVTDVWYVRSVQGSSYGVGREGDRYGIFGLDTSESWTHMQQALVADRSVSADWALMHEADRQAWERDGSPTYWPAGPETDGWEVPTRDAGYEYGVLHEPVPAGFGFGTESLDPAGLHALPSDRGTLADLLLIEEDASLEEDTEAHSATAAIRAVLTYPMTPDVRAGVYEVLAGIDGLRPLTEVADVSGRPATGVAFEFPSTDGSVLEQRILFDPETGMLLSSELAVVVPEQGKRDWSEPGDVVLYHLYEEMGWTDDWPL